MDLVAEFVDQRGVVSREFKLLVDRRDNLVSQRTAVINRLLWRVHELDPSHAPKPGSLDRAKHQKALRIWLATQPGLVAEVARDEVADIMALSDQIKTLENRIIARVRAAAPSLLKVFGCAELTAAKLVGDTAGVSRFRNEAAFARHAGVAPIPHWSGPKSVQIRPARSGNRQLNVALYRIAMTQIRHNGPGEAYYRKRRDAGDSHAEALRRVERRIARSVFGRLRADHINRPANCAGMRANNAVDGPRGPVSSTAQPPPNRRPDRFSPCPSCWRSTEFHQRWERARRLNRSRERNFCVEPVRVT